MPRHDDRHGNTRLYVGPVSSRTRSRDLERLFSKYGRVRDVDMRGDYAYVEFSDPRDADDARHYLDGRDFEGRRIIVKSSRVSPHGSRDNGGGRGPPPGPGRSHSRSPVKSRSPRRRRSPSRSSSRVTSPGTGRCFNCGVNGHRARHCKEGDWTNKCYRCLERGHIQRFCPNPKKARWGGSHSRSRVKSRSPRRRRSPSHSSSSGRSSYSRSRSPVKRERSVDDRSHSPKEMQRSVSSEGKDQSLSPERVIDASPKHEKQEGSENEGSPKENGNGRNSMSPIVEGEESREGLNGQDRSPIDDETEPNGLSPKASESP